MACTLEDTSGQEYQCRSCARLRYSEGGYLRPGVRFRALGNLPGPEPWLPYRLNVHR
jgi:hypothetical protein